MIYYSNGGFNWNDLYFMPTNIREFYWRKLLDTKDKEKEEQEKALNKAKSKTSTKTKRK